MPSAFRADWQNPLLFSWPIDREALEPWVPDGLAVDCWGGSAYISLVGLRLDSIRVLGIPTPIASYDEVNLRFYVRRRSDECDPRPGVVFVRQTVPHRFVSFMARFVFGEPFVAAPVSHRFCESETDFGKLLRRVAYQWRHGGRARQFWAEIARSDTTPAAPTTLEDFLTSRYWGYNGKPGTRTKTYQLDRPAWALREISRWEIDSDVGDVYGDPFAAAMRDQPASVILATGSRASVAFPTALAT